jgi:hypothetical protein
MHILHAYMLAKLVGETPQFVLNWPRRVHSTCVANWHCKIAASLLVSDIVSIIHYTRLLSKVLSDCNCLLLSCTNVPWNGGQLAVKVEWLFHYVKLLSFPTFFAFENIYMSTDINKKKRPVLIAEQMLGAGSSDVVRVIWTQSVRARINSTIRHDNRRIPLHTYCQINVNCCFHFLLFILSYKFLQKPLSKS